MLCPHCGKKMSDLIKYKSCPHCYRTTKNVDECMGIILRSENIEKINKAAVNKDWRAVNSELGKILYLDRKTLFAVQLKLFDRVSANNTAMDATQQELTPDGSLEKSSISQYTMLCPHCGAAIGITDKTVACPVCKTDIADDVEENILDFNFALRLLSNEDKNIISKLIMNGNRSAAMDYVGEIRGGMEPLGRLRVVRIIAQELGIPEKAVPEASTRDPSENANLILCPACNNLISRQAEACHHCGQPTGVHVCPNCQSTNTKVISGASKATSIFLWGPFAANKVVSRFQCKDCGHKW